MVLPIVLSESRLRQKVDIGSPVSSETSAKRRTLQNKQTIRPPVLLLGSGRCGSTLLQRVLNTSPEITVWGEHDGFLVDVARSYFTLTRGRLAEGHFLKSQVPYQSLIGAYRDQGGSINWANPFDQLHIQACFRRFLLDLFGRDLDTSRIHWGFKEILYGDRDRVIEMWRELFPETRYVFLVRNPYHVIRSMLIAWHPEKLERFQPEEVESLALSCAQRWRDTNQGILQWGRQMPARSMLIRYEDVVTEKEATVTNLFQFLQLQKPDAALDPLGVKIEVTRRSRLVPKVDRFLEEKREQINPVIGEIARTFAYSI